MNTLQHFTRSIVEPFLTVVVGLGIVLATLWFIEPKYFTHPSHFQKDVPNELIINEVNEMPNCHERQKRYLVSAGQIKVQDIDPRTLIMLCGG